MTILEQALRPEGLAAAEAPSSEDEVNEAGLHKEALGVASSESGSRVDQANHKTNSSITEAVEGAVEADVSAGETTTNHNETEIRQSRYGLAGS